ncbi:TniQ family protein [Dactylosporangium sp. CA-139114]|uniref:TniQ family protein n=1 Tax=Dactylosporangium sp. CA-139114 TaxID=3239931 RepID=UPI003D979041
MTAPGNGTVPVPRWHEPARPLPIPTQPLPDELLISYLRRLAANNHITVAMLINHLGWRRQHPNTRAGGTRGNHSDLVLNDAALNRLSIYSGSTTTTLRRATRTHALDTDDPTPATDWTALHSARLARPCSRCAATRGVHVEATIALAEQQPAICIEHRVALADPGADLPEQSLQRFPEVLAAAQRHLRLRRRRHATFRYAYTTAARLTRNWRPYAPNLRTAPEAISVRWQARAAHLNRPDTDNLVRYPETISLADLLSTLPWPADAAEILTKPIIAAPVHLLLQAAHALNHPTPRELLERGHPLCRWAGVPLRPGYWWNEQGPEPDRTAYFTLTRAKAARPAEKRSEPPRWNPPKASQPS